MIKVLFIHSQLVCGGIEQALYDLVSLMDKSKFDITVLVQYDGGIWEEKFRKAGIRVVSPWDGQVASSNPLRKLRNWYQRKRIAKAIAQDGKGLINARLGCEFDIIVSYGVWFMPHVGFSGRAKTVKFVHCDVDTNPKYCENILQSLDVMKRFDRIICVSDTARRSFSAQTGITENVCAHFNPLNSDNIHGLAAQEVALPDDRPLICAVGRLAEEKGFARLIRIHKDLTADGLLHNLVIVGDGPERENLMDLARSLQVESSVIFAGYSANPYPYMKRSDLLVCPSYTEGLGLVAMEALALGTPVVGAVPSIGELLGDVCCGLVTENDDASLKAGIRRMLSDQAFFQRAKAGAVERSAFFSGRQMVRAVEQEFEALLEQNNG